MDHIIAEYLPYFVGAALVLAGMFIGSLVRW